MLLAIDVGNTQTVVGIYEGERLRRMWRLTTERLLTGDEMVVKLRSLTELEGIAQSDVTSAVLASVVPALTHSWKDAVATLFDIDTFIVDMTTCAPLLNMRDDRIIAGTGADRIADVVAARLHYGTPVIVVDFGTATNLEVVDAQGSFIGGAVAPGIETSVAALLSRTALLPAIELDDPGTAIGDSTAQAMAVGIVYGEVDRVDGLVRRIWNELGYETAVVATGGLAERIAPLCSTVTAVDGELTLRGLHAIAAAAEK